MLKQVGCRNQPNNTLLADCLTGANSCARNIFRSIPESFAATLNL